MNKKKIITLAGLFILGGIVLVSASVAKKFRKPVEWDGTVYNIENVNPVDRKFAQPYNKTLDDIGDCFVVLSGAVVGAALLISFLKSKDKKEAFKSAVFDVYTFLVCGFYANGIYRILKTIAGRIRPYMYFANPSEKGIAEGDFFRSWPSGHTSNAFITFGFLLSWFVIRKADSKLKKPVLTVSFLVCVTTMILRLLSGNHFLTDVLSGAAIGFCISYAMAVLCNKIYNKVD